MISVCLSVYNTGQYLPKAMDFLLAQTYEDFEIIIVDDGSTDDSGEICGQQAARRPGSFFYHTKRHKDRVKPVFSDHPRCPCAIYLFDVTDIHITYF